MDECVIPFACHIPFQPVPCLACHHQNCTQKPKTTKDWCICENCAHSYQRFNPTDYIMPNLSGCHKKCPGSWQKAKDGIFGKQPNVTEDMADEDDMDNSCNISNAEMSESMFGNKVQKLNDEAK